MKPDTVNAIHDATLKARELMTAEISEQLEGIYGLLPSGEFNLITYSTVVICIWQPRRLRWLSSQPWFW